MHPSLKQCALPYPQSNQVNAALCALGYHPWLTERMLPDCGVSKLRLANLAQSGRWQLQPPIGTSKNLQRLFGKVKEGRLAGFPAKRPWLPHKKNQVPGPGGLAADRHPPNPLIYLRLRYLFLPQASWSRVET